MLILLYYMSLLEMIEASVINFSIVQHNIMLCNL